MSETQTNTAASKKRVAKKTAPKGAKPAVAVKAKPQKAAKPVVQSHNFKTGYTGASDVLNSRPSRQKIDFGRFGILKDAPLTDRDQKAVSAIRREFGQKAFERGNMDTGILRRLGERGVLAHVSGSDVDPKATFKLTNKGLGQATA